MRGDGPQRLLPAHAVVGNRMARKVAPHDLLHRGQARGGHLRKQVMLDLEIQPAEEPVPRRRIDDGARGDALVLEIAEALGLAHQRHADVVYPEDRRQVRTEERKRNEIGEQDVGDGDTEEDRQPDPEREVTDQYGSIQRIAPDIPRYFQLREQALAVTEKKR